MQLFKLNKMFFNYKISSKICRKKFFSNSNGPGNNTKNIETKTSIEQTINSKLNLNAINPVSAQAKEEEKQYLFGPISKDLRDYYNIKDKNSQYFIPKSTVGKIERDFGEKVSESMRKALSFDNASQRELNKWYYFQIAKYFGKSPNDTASYEVQAAILTHKINRLREHIKIYRKDSKAKYNLIKEYHRRNKVLKKLREEDFARFKKAITFCDVPDMWDVAVTSKHRRELRPTKKKPKLPNLIFEK